MIWVEFYIIIGLGLALGCATNTKVGRDKSWGWGPATMVILGWLPLGILVFIITPIRKRMK